MNKGKTVLVLLLLAVLSLPVRTAAQRRTFVEWGVLGGLNFSDFSSKDKSFDVSNKLGFQAGISIGVNLGLVAIQPEILFVRQTFGVEHADIGRVKVKSNSIDVPVLLSVRVLKPLRINVGPVFSVMNDCKYKWGSDLIDFGRARPTVSYTLGLGLVLGRNLLIDCRYNGQFTSKKTYYTEDAVRIDLKSYSVGVSIGYVF
ncbi:porin family protein [Alistipes sp.]|uniref:porin family protein n=1 Tax=Alistipes sp. TaxID=1872444 RepID=UPI003AB1AB2E